MGYTFKKVETDHLFLSIDPRPATEKERSEGLPETVSGFRPTGNEVVDLVIRIVFDKGHITRRQVARLMGVDEKLLQYTLRFLTGHSFLELRNSCLIPMIDDLLKQKSVSLQKIADRLGFTNVSVLSHFYRNETRISLFEKRHGYSYHLD